MTKFNELLSSVSLYVSVILGAILKGKEYTDLVDSDSLPDSSLVDDCLSKAWVEMTRLGLEIDVKSEASDPVKLSQVFNPVLLPFKALPITNQDKKDKGLTHRFVIRHEHVFRFLFKLGFDFRDIFDVYEAARLKGSLDSKHAHLHQFTREQFAVYSALAMLTKQLEEIKRKCEIFCKMIAHDDLVILKNNIQDLWKLVTKEVTDYANTNDVRAIIIHTIQKKIYPMLDKLIQDSVLRDSGIKTTHHLIYLDIETIYCTLIKLVSSLRMPHRMIKLSSANHESASEAVYSYPQMISSLSSSFLDVSLNFRVGRIKSHPITGNVQLGSVIEVGAKNKALENNSPHITPPIHAMFIVDISGSMRAGRLDKVVTLLESSIGHLKRLNPKNTYTLITFGDKAYHEASGEVSSYDHNRVSVRTTQDSGGCENLDQVALLLKKDFPRHHDYPDRQSVIILFSDGGIVADYQYAKANQYLGNEGSSRLVRDTLIKQGIVNPSKARFVAVGVGSSLTCDVLSTFADADDVLVLADNESSDIIFPDLAAKLQPFITLSVDSIAQDHRQEGLLSIIKGRSLAEDYESFLVSVLQQKTSYTVAMLFILPFVMTTRSQFHLADGEKLKKVNKFVYPARQLNSPISFFGCIEQINQRDIASLTFMGNVDPAAEEEVSVEEAVAEYEKRMVLIQNPEANQVACALALGAGRVVPR